ncbi:MAG: 30S ribosomal protein S7 [Methermicoccaceae archaeon]
MDKIFGKWDTNEVEIADRGVACYINLKPVFVLHTSGRHAKQIFAKSEQSIVERLINRMMQKEKNTGKKARSYNIVKEAFDIIYEKSGKNPIQMLCDAIANAGPREEVVRLKYGGIVVPKAVDTSSQRRVDQALKFISHGAWQMSFKSKKSIAECLADEIIAVASYDAKSYAISQKDAKERVAKGAR